MWLYLSSYPSSRSAGGVQQQERKVQGEEERKNKINLLRIKNPNHTRFSIDFLLRLSQLAWNDCIEAGGRLSQIADNSETCCISLDYCTLKMTLP